MRTINLAFNGRRLAQGNRECVCFAKRYVPAGKQRKGGPGGGSRPGGPARKPSRDDEGEGVADTDELLRELNSGGAGWLRDEEEADWGLDDVAEHARARQQKQALTGAGPSAPFGDGDPASGSLRGGGGGGRRRRGGSVSAAALELEQGGSPLASGLARITSDDGEAAGGTGGQQAQWVEEWAVGGGAAAARAPAGGLGDGDLTAAAMGAAAAAVTAMELEESYARRNPELVEALQLQGIKIRIRRSEGEYGDLDDILEGTEAAAAAAALDEDDEFGSDLDLDLGLQTDLAEPEDVGKGKGKGGGGGGSADWYSSLAAAGFSVRTSATGEVFLERTTTRRKSAAPAATSAAAASATPAASPAAAAAAAAQPAAAAAVAAAAAQPPSKAAAPASVPTTAAIRQAQKQQVAAAVAATASSAPAAATAAEASAAAARQLLPPLVGRPAVAAALKLLSTPQQVLDFLELAYPQWAANGFRLLDQRSGRPIPNAPSPAEAAHCLHALALTARRSDIGGWRCLDVAAGRQAQGLAECLRATPPRALQSDAATAQLSAQMFDAARRYWLTDPHPLPAATPPTPASATAQAVLPMLDNPRAKGLVLDGQDGVTASSGGSRSGGEGGAAGVADDASAASAADDADFDAELEALASKLQQQGQQGQPQPGSSGSGTAGAGAGEDASYLALANKYAILSERKKRREAALAALRQAKEQQLQRATPALNGHAPSGAAAVAATGKAAAAVVEPRLAAATAVAPGGAATRAQAAKAAKAAEAATAAAERWLVKVDCLVAALWGMSTLGGTPYFTAETEALLAILVRCLASASAAAAGASAASAAAAAAAAAAGQPATASASASASGGTPPSVAGAGALGGWQAGQVLWALGNSRHVTPRLPDLEAAMIKAGGLSAMSPRDVTRVLWGFASLGHTPAALLLSIRADWSWREQAPGAAAAAAVAAAEQDINEEQAGKRRGKGKKGKAKGGRSGDVRDFSPQQLAGVVWALAAMRQVDTVPFRTAWAQLLQRAAEVPPAEPVLTQIWQANLALHLESEDASLRAAAASAAAASSSPSSSSSSRSSGTISLGASPAAKRRGSNGSPGGPSAEDLTAVGLAAAASAPTTITLNNSTSTSTSSNSASSSSASASSLDPGAARALLLRARDVFLSATSGLRRRVQSSYQRQMANALTALRHMHLLEDNSAGYSIDITLPALRIAIEADGPTHTSRTPGGAVLGATAMKRRHLQRLGWQVINVTYTEWDKLSSDAARRTFLQDRINQALVNSLDVGNEL
ncbi:hypothetical protein HYH02_002473 [Chlamydomonas schloesseri]|uniref:RAP domain-containing protein n=1 Tax=Chlamydomonas schloesseri TaxID=2026947 RepID=A0A835WSH7_9CHLO|nr:hypothetical protein HYH02_002473 [Chlamydomonas schloesseri]|eukprot:KAG2453147.1 hypothetical protein HYH02_002473 [Chlamydomonas schloesseri]